MSFHSQDENFGNQTLEDSSEYERMIQMTFSSEEDGYEFFNSFTRHKGFSVRKGKVRRSSNGGDITCRHFFCFKQGTRQPMFLKNMANKKRGHEH
uniref:FAR1 domain-containing protein n=1 Tax=Arundo donax TaxID=35708 RepID=A0A0A9GM25_ARUDO